MRNASREIRAVLHELVATIEPGDRFHLSGELFAYTRYLVRTAVLMAHPDATEVEIQQQTFMHFYGRDFTPEQREHIFDIIERRFAVAPDGAA
jgi:hypothetical protein